MLEKINLKKELSLNQTALLLIPGEDYNEGIINIMKDLSENNIVYVTLNKTADSLKEIFRKNSINIKNIAFIDAISKTLKKVSGKEKNSYYVSSPGALTELSLVITKFLAHKFDYLILDSLTNLTIYQKKEPCARFLLSLTDKIKKGNTKAVFYALDVKEQEDLIKKTGMFVDKVINYSSMKSNNKFNNKK